MNSFFPMSPGYVRLQSLAIYQIEKENEYLRNRKVACKNLSLLDFLAWCSNNQPEFMDK